MSRILSFGDSPKIPSGYGTVNRHIIDYLASKGHDIYHVAWSHMEPTEKISDRVTLIRPKDGDAYSSQTVLQATMKYNPDYVFTSNDYFVWMYILEGLVDHRCKKIGYSIIDGPFSVKLFEPIIKRLSRLTSATHYACNELARFGYQSDLIPHGVDSQVFRILNKTECKKDFGFEDFFVYGCVNRNNWRKNFPGLMRAFSIVKKKYPDSMLFLVCDARDPAGNDLYAYGKVLDLTVSTDLTVVPDVFVHPAYAGFFDSLSTEDLVRAYNMMNVHVTGTIGEGFGLTVLESMSCGVPSVAPNHSTIPELVKGRGWLVPNAKNIDGSDALIHSGMRETSYFNTVTDPIALAQQMILAREQQDLMQEYILESRKFAKSMDWQKVLPLWDEVFV